MIADEETLGWTIVILFIAIFVVGYFSYKDGFNKGQEDRAAWDFENADHFCKDALQDDYLLDEFCKVPIEHYVEDKDNIAEICSDSDYIKWDNCYDYCTDKMKNNGCREEKNPFD